MKRITSFNELEQICNQVRDCAVVVNGEPCVIGVRSLTPDEDQRIQQILKQAMPPKLTGAGPNGEDQWDLDNAEFKAARDKHQLEARALTIYLACPTYREAIQAQHGSEPTREQILDFVQKRISARTVAQIYASIVEDEPTQQEYADFFLKRGSVPN